MGNEIPCAGRSSLRVTDIKRETSSSTPSPPRHRRSFPGQEAERHPSSTTRAASSQSTTRQNHPERGVERLPPSTNLASQPSWRQRSVEDERKHRMKKYSYIPDRYTSLEQSQPSMRRSSGDPSERQRTTTRPAASGPSTDHRSLDRRRSQLIQKYAFIPDNFTSVHQVFSVAMDSCCGKRSFDGQSLHKIGGRPNPYEQAITIIGKVLAPFDDDNLIPCFGFGDRKASYALPLTDFVSGFPKDRPPLRPSWKPPSTSWSEVEDNTMCWSSLQTARFCSLLLLLRPLPPRCFLDQASIEDWSHDLSVKVTRSVDINDGDLSPQEKKTIDSIVMARYMFIAHVCAQICKQAFELITSIFKILFRFTMQFVNFTAIMGKTANAAEKEAAFALAALMEVPIQYKATLELGILGWVRHYCFQTFSKRSLPLIRLCIQARDREGQASCATPSSITSRPKTQFLEACTKQLGKKQR
ncbi:hypothetical protein GW17_00052373 [Ensete ventricosum]|nr:hypothetical protein GW17_00052373 [Ensete ventricosum]